MHDGEAMTLSDSMCDEGLETPAGGRCHFSAVTRERLTSAFFDNYMGRSLSVGSLPLFLPCNFLCFVSHFLTLSRSLSLFGTCAYSQSQAENNRSALDC